MKKRRLRLDKERVTSSNIVPEIHGATTLVCVAISISIWTITKELPTTDEGPPEGGGGPPGSGNTCPATQCGGTCPWSCDISCDADPMCI